MLTIGLLGCGVVGGGVAARLLRSRSLLGTPVQLGRVLVRDLRKPRYPETVIPFLTTDAQLVVGDPKVDIVVEAIGGLEPTRTYVETALRAGKHVVTSNKALVATHGAALSRIADECGAAFRYEASVAGAVPVVRTLGEILVEEKISEIAGVLNGTSSFILQAMRTGISLDEAIRRAQEAGYAEADPSDDLDGVDAARKLAVLAPLAFRRRIDPERIPRISLRTLRPEHFELAERLGATIVPLALLRDRGAQIEATVAPTLVAEDHEFARLSGPENAVRVIGEHCGTLRFYGHGAGREATASAVLSDLAEIARRRARRQAQAVVAVDFPETIPAAAAQLLIQGGFPLFEFVAEAANLTLTAR